MFGRKASCGGSWGVFVPRYPPRGSMLPSSWICVESTRTKLRCGRALNEASSRSSCREERSLLCTSLFFKELGYLFKICIRECQSGMTRGVCLEEENPAGRTAVRYMAQEPENIIVSYTDAQ